MRACEKNPGDSCDQNNKYNKSTFPLVVGIISSAICNESDLSFLKNMLYKSVYLLFVGFLVLENWTSG